MMNHKHTYILSVVFAIIMLTNMVAFAKDGSPINEDLQFYPGVWHISELDRAEALVAQNDQLAAIKLYEKYLATDSLNQKAWYRLAQLYSWNDMPDKALYCYEQLAKLDPLDKDVLQKLAQYYVWTDRQKEAIHIYRKLIMLDPENIEYHKKLAQLYSWNDMPDRAIAEYEKIVRLDSTDIQTMKILAQNYFWTDRAKEGIHLLQKIVAMQPDSLNLRRQLAQQYEWQGEPEKALDEYRAIFKRQPDDTLSLRKLAQLSMSLNRYNDAEHYYQLLIRKQPENTRLHLALGKLYLWSNRAATAIPEFEKYLKIHPDDKEALALLGEAQRWSGQWEQAKENLRAVLRVDPRYSRARELLAGIREQYGPLWENKYLRIHDSNQLTLEQIPIGYKVYYNQHWVFSLGLTRYRIMDGRVDSSLAGMGASCAVRYNLSNGLAFGTEISPRFYTSKWNPVDYKLQFIQTLTKLTAQLEFYHRETQEGVQAILDRIVIKGLRGELYWQATRRWYLSVLLDRGAYSDGNKKTTGLLYSQYAFFMNPQISLYGSYSYEDFQNFYPASLPYWTPDQLHTLTLGLDMRRTFWQKVLCAGGLGLTRQQGIYSQNAHMQIGLNFSRFDQFYIRYEKIGSRVYNSQSFIVYFHHRF